METFKEMLALSVSNLKKEVVAHQKKLFHFRFQKKMGEVKPHEIRNARKTIARLKTVLSLKSFQEGK